MFDETKIERNDALGQQLRTAYDQMTPPPALEQAVRNGVPYSPKVSTKIHVRRFAKAIVSYAICVALLLGGVYLVSQLLNEQKPIATNPSNTTTSVKNPDQTDKPNDPDTPPVVEFPYTALPSNADLLLELAKYVHMDVMDRILVEQGLELKEQAFLPLSQADFYSSLYERASGMIYEMGKYVEDVRPSDISFGVSKIVSSYSTSTDKVVVILRGFVRVDYGVGINEPEQYYIGIFEKGEKNPDGSDRYEILSLHETTQYGKTDSEQRQQEVQRLIDLLAAIGNPIQTERELLGEEKDAITAFLETKEVWNLMHTRESFYRPEDCDLWELSRAYVPGISSKTCVELSKITDLATGRNGNKWIALPANLLETYCRDYLGIEDMKLMTDRLLSAQDNLTFYLEGTDTYYLYVPDWENKSQSLKSYTAWKTDTGDVVVWIVTEGTGRLTALLTPDDKGSYDIIAIQRS